MLTWKTVRLGVIAALALFALALFAVANATEKNRSGTYDFFSDCGTEEGHESVDFDSKMHLTNDDIIVVVFGGPVFDCAGGGTGSFTNLRTSAQWNDWHLKYRCPAGSPMINTNTLNITGKVEMDLEYGLLCPSSGIKHGAVVPNVGDAVVSATFVEPFGGVGGIAELPEIATSPLAAPDSSGTSAGVLAGGAGAVVAGVIALGGAAWYARRRFARS